MFRITIVPDSRFIHLCCGSVLYCLGPSIGNGNFEAGAGEEPSNLNWLMSHLEMRDFFLDTAFAAGDRIVCSTKRVYQCAKCKNMWRGWHDSKCWSTALWEVLQCWSSCPLDTLHHCSNNSSETECRKRVDKRFEDSLESWRRMVPIIFLLEDHWVGGCELW